MAVALGEGGDLLFRAGQGGLAYLQRLGQCVVALGQGRPGLFVVLDLALAGFVLLFRRRAQEKRSREKGAGATA